MNFFDGLVFRKFVAFGEVLRWMNEGMNEGMKE
jgi:hypothetical protein